MNQPPVVDPESDRLRALDQLEHALTNHAPTGQAVIDRFEYVRNHAKSLGTAIINNCPPSRERSLAITNLEQATMWAIASIARNQAATS